MPDDAIRVEVLTPFPMGSVNCWILPGDPLTLVDTGPLQPAGLEALERGFADAGLRLDDVGLLVLTHQHPDHVGLATAVQERSGCRVAGHRLLAGFLHDVDAALDADDAWEDGIMRFHGMPAERREAWRAGTRTLRSYLTSVDVDVPLEEGDTLRAGGRDLRVALRPGHSPSDTIFVVAGTGVALVGDHLVAHVASNPVVSRPLGGPGDVRTRRFALAEYLDSMARTDADALQLLHSGHGASITDAHGLIADRVARTGRGRERVLGALDATGRTAAELSLALFPDVAPARSYLPLSAVLGVLELLEDDGLVRVLEEDAGRRYARA